MRRRLVGAGLCVTVAAGAGVAYMAETNRVPDIALPPLEQLPPQLSHGGTTLICSRAVDCTESSALASLTADQPPTPIKNFSELQRKAPYVAKAFVAIEDNRFYQNDGCDVQAIARAIKSNAKNRLEYKLGVTDTKYNLQGGSTITRQVISNDYQLPTARQLQNDVPMVQFAYNLSPLLGVQAYECREARKLTAVKGKSWILKQYMSSIFFGRQATGIEDAAQAFFGKPAEDLNVQQAAILAGIPNAPSAMDVDFTKEQFKLINSSRTDPQTTKLRDQYQKESSLLQGRTQQVVSAMAAQGYISRAQEEKLDKTPISLNYFVPHATGAHYGFTNSDELGARHYTELIRQEAASLLGKKDVSQIENGYRIHTCLDIKDQAALVHALHSDPAVNADHSLSAIGLSMRKDGCVVAMSQTVPYDVSQVNMPLGRAGGGSGWDAGSTNKVYALTYAFENGWTLTGDDEGKKLKITPAIDVPVKGGRTWRIDTGQGCDHLGLKPPCVMTPEQGLAYSSNIMAGKIVKEFSLPPLVNKMHALGLEKTDPNDPSVVLGVGPFSPYTEAGGFAAVGLNGGKTVNKHFITSIQNSAGQTVYKYKAPHEKQVFDPGASHLAVKAMQGVVRYGTAKNTMQPPNGINSVAGKTGSGDRYYTLWFDGVACDNKRGSRAASFLVTHTKGKIPDVLDKNSAHVAAIFGDYVEHSLTTGKLCNVAESAR